MSPLFLGVVIGTDEDLGESNDSDLLEEEAATKADEKDAATTLGITETKTVFTLDKDAELGGQTFFEEDADDEAESDVEDEADESETEFRSDDDELLLNVDKAVRGRPKERSTESPPSSLLSSSSSDSEPTSLLSSEEEDDKNGEKPPAKPEHPLTSLARDEAALTLPRPACKVCWRGSIVDGVCLDCGNKDEAVATEAKREADGGVEGDEVTTCANEGDEGDEEEDAEPATEEVPTKNEVAVAEKEASQDVPWSCFWCHTKNKLGALKCENCENCSWAVVCADISCGFSDHKYLNCKGVTSMSACKV